MIFVGIDDTDVLDSRGTNHLARDLVAGLAPRWWCDFVLRHQLLVEPRIPYTSHNGSASIHLRPRGDATIAELIGELRSGMLADFIDGSDPGLCVTANVPDEIVAFGRRCIREVVPQEDARALAAAHGIHLEGLGGSEDGVIGALAAIGLGACGDHGRVVLNRGLEDLTGPQPVAAVLAEGVEALIVESGGDPPSEGTIDVGKRLRPNRRGGRTVLFLEATGPGVWRALRRD